jgi:hypothetical protein
MKNKNKISVLILILVGILLCSLNYAIGPAPITIVGYIDNTEITNITVELLEENQKVNHSVNIILETEGIQGDEKLKYAIIISTTDTINDLYLNVDFNNANNQTLYRREIPIVNTWNIVKLNISQEETKKENLIIQKSRLNSIANEMQITEHLYQIEIRNQTYIDNNFEVIVVDDVDENGRKIEKLTEKNIEKPMQFSMKLITQNQNYIIIIVLISVILLQFTSLIMHRKKVKSEN